MAVMNSPVGEYTSHFLTTRRVDALGWLAICANSQMEGDMDPERLARYEARAQVLKALAHPSRLFIVDELASGPRSVGDLAREIGADISTVSRHLSVLKNAGIVSQDRRGNRIYYRLLIPCVLGFFTCAQEVIEEVVEQVTRVAQSGGVGSGERG